MPKGYWISAYRSVSDPDKLAAYGALAGPALEAAGARFLARAPHAVPHEAGLDQRTVIVEFDSVEAAVAAYESEAYQKALVALGDGAVRDHRIVEGVE